MSTTPGRFVHPGGAYSLVVPAGWSVHAFVDEIGYPFHVFTADSGEDPVAYPSGLWVYAVPIATDQSLEPGGNLQVLVSSLLMTREPKLRVTADTDSARLGTLRGSDVHGRDPEQGGRVQRPGADCRAGRQYPRGVLRGSAAAVRPGPGQMRRSPSDLGGSREDTRATSHRCPSSRRPGEW